MYSIEWIINVPFDEIHLVEIYVDTYIGDHIIRGRYTSSMLTTPFVSVNSVLTATE